MHVRLVRRALCGRGVEGGVERGRRTRSSEPESKPSGTQSDPSPTIPPCGELLHFPPLECSAEFERRQLDQMALTASGGGDLRMTGIFIGDDGVESPGGDHRTTHSAPSLDINLCRESVLWHCACHGDTQGSRPSNPVFPLSRSDSLRNQSTARNADRAVLVDFRRFPACAVERRAFLVGANPTRQLSLQPVATGAAHGGNDMG